MVSSWCFVVGLTRIELVTSALSGQRSNQLSYSPSKEARLSAPAPFLNWRDASAAARAPGPTASFGSCVGFCLLIWRLGNRRRPVITALARNGMCSTPATLPSQPPLSPPPRPSSEEPSPGGQSWRFVIPEAFDDRVEPEFRYAAVLFLELRSHRSSVVCRPIRTRRCRHCDLCYLGGRRTERFVVVDAPGRRHGPRVAGID
jgi:hypothetical protein